MTDEIYALDLDEEFLSHLAIEDSWIYLQGEEFDADLIEDEEVRKIYYWQRDHKRQHGHLATPTVLADQFDIDFAKPETRIGDLLDRLRLRFMNNGGREYLRRVIEQQRDGDPLEVPGLLLRAGRELSFKLAKRGEVFGTGDYDRIMNRYEQKVARGPGASYGYPLIDEYYNGMHGLNFLLGYKKSGKALALDTPIPVPGGWTDMGDLRVGDQVFDENGTRCNVVGVSQVWTERPCYRVVFADGSSIIADAEHEWMTQSRVPIATKIRTTQDIAESVRYTQGSNHSIRVAGPLECDERDLPIDPYVLGAWLGDGTAADAAISSADQEILDQITKAGYRISKWGSAEYVYGILGGFRTQLRTNGLLNNKHIPEMYLRASVDQRMSLLQGIMDTDGTCGKRGSCSLTWTNKSMVDQLFELICSLGFKPLISESRATLSGKDCGPVWIIRFHASPDRPVFRIARKLERQGSFYAHEMSARSQIRKIVAVEPVSSVPVRCITVDSPSHLFLAGRSMVPTHNSWQMLQSLAMNAQDGRYPWLYSLELPADETDTRLRFLLADIPWWKYVHNSVTNQDKKVLREVSEMIDGLGLYKIVKPAQGSRGINEMISRARDAGAGIVIIDQLQYVENDKGKSLGRLNDTGEYYGVLNDARDLSDQGPIYVAHQFGRAAAFADSMPDISLAKSSSSIEEVATSALGIWANKDMRRSGVMQIGELIGRNTQNVNQLWEMKVEMSRGCSFEVLREIEDINE